LRALAYSISSNSETLDLKQCADLLYAMAVLNFPDSILIARIGIDIANGLAENLNKPAAIGSIITSLGLLKFRNADVIENLTDWMLKHRDICRPQDISSLILTLATLNYPTDRSEEIKSKLVTGLVENDFSKSSEWLTHVWALVVLDFAETQHFKSVLGKKFIEKLVFERKGDLLSTMKMKLLNINAASKCEHLKYDGPVLSEESEIFSVPLAHSKNKIVLINGLLDALKTLFLIFCRCYLF